MTVAETSVYNTLNFDTVEHLKRDLLDLTDHNKLLKREISDLRKEQLAWRETQRQVGVLEAANSFITSEFDILKADHKRLRRKNEELALQLEHEAAVHQAARLGWSEREAQLIAQARADREKLRGYLALNNSSSYQYEDDEEAESTDESEKVSGLNAKLAEVTAKNTQQAKEIRELRLLLEAVVAHANDVGGFQRTPLRIDDLMQVVRSLVKDASSSSGSSSADDSDSGESDHSDDIRGRHHPTPSPEAGSQGRATPSLEECALQYPNGESLADAADPMLEDPFFASYERSLDASTAAASSMAFFEEALSAAAAANGELAPEFVSEAASSTLQSKLAAYGLRTDGNRKARKKRLDRFRMNKKKEARGSAASAASPYAYGVDR
ncbi:hypothetical protein HDU96_006282 [Phlyctochytrium bullatum]|nr:hypothetical protein HDU96_006282 [Phlyctochytrium bullatum]